VVDGGTVLLYEGFILRQTRRHTDCARIIADKFQKLKPKPMQTFTTLDIPYAAGLRMIGA
jgi:hypothetical protein